MQLDWLQTSKLVSLSGHAAVQGTPTLYQRCCHILLGWNTASMHCSAIHDHLLIDCRRLEAGAPATKDQMTQSLINLLLLSLLSINLLSTEFSDHSRLSA